MLDREIGALTGSPVITRYPGNPILKDGDVPYARGLVYNGSVIKHGGRYVMLVRVDHADVARQEMRDVTDIALAFSDDGLSWEVQPSPAIDWRSEEVVACSDPRLMPVEGRPHVTVAVQTRHGMETWGVATTDFRHYEPVFKVVPDDRDIVLFPEKVGGKYLRLERPFPTFGHGRRPVFDIWLSESPDLVYWGNPHVLLDVEHVPYANLRVGPGTPPLKTERGWLLLFHAVDDDPGRGRNGWEEKWTERYSSGVLLLDLDDPRKIIGLSSAPLLAPEAPYEVQGYRDSIVFPCGWVLEADGEVKIYYGAADTVQCLATAHVDDLLSLCSPPPAREPAARKSTPCRVKPCHMENTEQTQESTRHRVAYVGTYPPQECGIATFTLDLVNATDISGWCSVVAAVGDGDPQERIPESADAPDEADIEEDAPRFPDVKQVYAIARDDRSDYARAARFVGKLGSDLISIQHEYGIYGGDHGEYVLDLARTAQVPVVVTLHTILPEPSPRQRAIIRDLSPHVARFVVMAHKGQDLLQSAYGIPPEKISFIPHGAPDVFLEVEGATKDSLGLQGRRVLSTFGLISPNKGIEDAIAALPALVEREPSALYLVLGATHPTVKRREGEWYRESLERQVKELGLQDNVRFVNHFLSVQELIDYLLATDVYITPYYANPHQITSGTLAYAMATGRVIVSTPYLYAEELLAEGRGFLYPFRDTQVLSETLTRLLTDDALFEAARKKAYTYGRAMTWPCVGVSYVNLFREILREHGIDPGPAPEAFATAGHREVVRELAEEAAG